jgi:uncharacterized protein
MRRALSSTYRIMRKRIRCLAFITAVLCLAGSRALADAATLPLDSGWKFHAGDDLKWSTPSLDESGWKDILVGRSWKEQGHTGLAGFAWYRLRFKLPTSLKQRADVFDRVYLVLGQIGDYDETYLNGHVIGRNGIIIRDGTSSRRDFRLGSAPRAHYRKYTLPSYDSRLHWDQENVIAVRVFARGHRGGIVAGPVSIGLSNIPLEEDREDRIPLRRQWKYHKGEDPDWAKPAFNDSDWPIFDREQKNGSVDFTGITWYRQVVMIPSRLKHSSSFDELLKIELGPLFDQYQAFLNGHALSPYDRTPDLVFPYYPTAKTITFLIPVDAGVIDWDHENVLALRLLNEHNKVAPSILGPGYISMAGFEDFVHFVRKEPLPVECRAGTEIPIVLDAENKSAQDRPAVVRVQVRHKRGELAYSKTSKVVLLAENRQSFRYSFRPKIADAYTLSYRLTDNKSGQSTGETQLLAFVRPAPNPIKHLVKPVVRDKVPNAAYPVPLENAHLGGLLGRWVGLDVQMGILHYLKNETPTLMEGFYARPGTATYQGEFWGKYVQAGVNMWRYTGDPELKAQLDRTVDIVIASQMADGYSGTYTAQDRWTDWDVWVHKYVLFGLMSYYSATGYQPALTAAVRIGDYFAEHFGSGSGKIDILSGPHKGLASTSILEPMVLLYEFTGEQRYLRFCQRIVRAYDEPYGPHVISQLLQNGRVDEVADGKGYELLSNLLGLLRLYHVTGMPTLLNAVEQAWEDIARNRTFITGSATEGESFRNHKTLGDIETWPAESCVSAHWFQLSLALYQLTADPKYLDELEKTAYNHLLAPMNPRTGGIAYYCPLQNKKPYRVGLTCCNSSLPRAIALLPNAVWAKLASGGVAINLYNPGEFHDLIATSQGPPVKVRIRVNGDFPKSGRLTISVAPDNPAKFRVALRVPAWCRSFHAKVGTEEYAGQPGTYLNLVRIWQPGDQIAVSMGLDVRLVEAGPEYPGFRAFLRGPQVLAVDANVNGLQDLDGLRFKPQSSISLEEVENFPPGWVGQQGYSSPLLTTAQGKPVVLVPYADAGQLGGDLRVWIGP